MKLNHKHIVGNLVIMPMIALAASNAYAGKLYKWVDKNGVVSYQDQPPPKDAKVLSEKEVKSSAGSSISQQQEGLPRVVIYTVQDCAVCEYFVTMMKKSNVPHIELPLQTDREAQAKILAKLDGLSAPTFFIGEEILQTSSGDELRSALSAAGYEITQEKNDATAATEE